MKLVTAAEMRDLDSRTINEYGTPGIVLMDRAGKGVADWVLKLTAECGVLCPSALLVAGKGNNGGDAFVAARYLFAAGVDVKLLLAGARDIIPGDSAHHMQLMEDCGIEVVERPDECDWVDADAYRDFDVVVEGLLGTGLSGAPRGVSAAAILFVNSLSADMQVVAIDIPSGLNADTGEAEGVTVKADLTISMGLPKGGFVSALSYTGAVETVDIGIPEEYTAPLSSRITMTSEEDASKVLTRRDHGGHKGDYGHVLIVGGSRGYSGAAMMAADAAVRSGAGLVSVLTPASVAPAVAAGVKEAMVHWGQETESGSLAASPWCSHFSTTEMFDAVVIGPGLTQHEQCRTVVGQILEESRVPVLLDADALNVLNAEDGLIAGASCSCVITPHPGELARFMGMSTAEVQADRQAAAAGAAELTGAVVVLKGAGTVIADGSGAVCVNTTGNPGMATGGTGDVLSGLLGGFLAQGIGPLDASRAAVYLHGRAGDSAARRFCQAAVTAGDVIMEIAAVMGSVSER